MHRFRVVAVAVVAAIVSVSVGAVGAGGAAAASSCFPAPGLSGGGVVKGASPGAGFLYLSNSDQSAEVSAARKAGVRTVRVDVDWSAIETAPGVFNWASTDRAMTAVANAGMCPLGLIGFTPKWATNPADNATDSHYRPADPARYGQFVRTAAQRYRSAVSAWEIWNEPNTLNFFEPHTDAAYYTQLLRAGYAAVKGVSTSLGVISAGMAPAADNGRDIAPQTFLAGMYDAGARGSFDAVAMHPYTYPYLPNDPSTSSFSAAQQMWPMHDIMVNRGDGAKRIWMTEYGAPTGTSPVSVTPQTQADTVRIILDAAKGTSWLGPAYVYSIRDAGSDPTDPEQNFGMLYRDFAPKPAYQVLASYT
ncbi:glycoside hydrolase 5 family protein [Williamsia deligens]|uniref:Beta-xylosidase n=1 Tax=Williamsia deligens TaxID=321325 RepID=A0ABW3G2Z1_9NOCA|nr:beta-xylosidase [Williamsia deligens]MCP2194739.1 Glycosyl hydrolases family 39 [Williamsia deligens]